MSPELLQWISRTAPLIGTLLLVAFGIGAIAARNRISTGSTGAGPRDIVTPTVNGLTESAWNLTALDQLVEHNPGWILATLSNEARRLGIDLTGLDGTASATRDDLLVVLGRLEDHLQSSHRPPGGTP